MTNQDLYPKEEWNFVFGLANLDYQCGVFSFCRTSAKTTIDMDPVEVRLKFLATAIGIMVHEIGHMFGIRHCIYYECTMNGTQGSFESEKGVEDGICPMCLYKLKANIKFDTRERYEKLMEVCEAIGFKQDVARI